MSLPRLLRDLRQVIEDGERLLAQEHAFLAYGVKTIDLERLIVRLHRLRQLEAALSRWAESARFR